MSDHVIPADTIDRQRRAADPAASAWVSANAGAGKTRVLTDRVVRLLLSGAAPSRILCLTFTKAAAAEMTIRVFKLLGSWVTMPAEQLTAALEALTGERPSGAELARSRRLFARAVETPGGLKIETIHAFCERLLHLVPFEAEVPPRFAVLDESQTGELLAAARARILIEAGSGIGRGQDLAAALAVVATWATGDGLTVLVDRAVVDDAVPDGSEARQAAIAALRERLGLEPGVGSEAVRREMLEDGIPPSEWPALGAELRLTGKPADAIQAASFDEAATAATQEGRLAAYRSIFFTEKNGPRKQLATKGVAPGVCDALIAERERLMGLADRLAAAETVERTDALYLIAAAVRAEMEAQKRRLGALDFADLIRKALDLLGTADAAAWVLYKLDRGIDHVLVDEAQDTNPQQWDILRRLTEEFTAGAGRPVAKPRTVFAVGDPKQSIYSFQGADPRLFEGGRRHWMGRTERAKLGFEDVRLTLSFRSAPAILQAVDDTFGLASHFRGLSFDATASGTTHQSARPDAPGQVEIWPTEVRSPGKEPPDAWAAPVDEPEQDAPAVIVARKIARAVAVWTTGGTDGRVWRPGEILLLVRTRGPAFFAVIRALKAAGIRVAGADRFDVGEHIAVADLVAAGEAAQQPRNDLALASALKSPLVGLDDDDLMRIAMDRDERESLAEALERCAADGDAKAAEGRDALESWRGLARVHGPFGFYAALLGPGGGRRRLIGRLGGEAADAIDAFLNYAQAAEQGPDTPSLTGFLARFASADHTIKRDLDAGSDEVRVMTVHGAKGLEAPLVVVIDGCETAGKEPMLVPVDIGGQLLPVWSPGKAQDCGVVAEAREDARALRLEEHNRLLYVAMTRAKDRLVVAPFLAIGKEPEAAWCAMVRRGFAEKARELAAVDLGYGPVAIWSDREAAQAPAAPQRIAPAESPLLPDWLRKPVEPEPVSYPRLRPSEVRAIPGPADRRADRAEARLRGTLLHDVIEHAAPLPDRDRPAAASRFLAARAARLNPAEREGLVSDTLAILRHPVLAPLFGPGSRAEAPIIGRLSLPGGRALDISGRIDRMAILGDAIWLADFKSGAGDVEADAAYLPQLALYRAALEAAFPERHIRALLVWAAGPRSVEPEPADLDRALALALTRSS